MYEETYITYVCCNTKHFTNVWRNSVWESVDVYVYGRETKIVTDCLTYYLRSLEQVLM